MPVEKTSPTQPFPVKPPPLARMDFTMADIATVTPELEAACRKLIADNNVEVGGGPYAPPSYNHSRVIFPSEIGGANWGGASFNPALGFMFVNVNDLGQVNGVPDPASGPVDREGHRRHESPGRQNGSVGDDAAERPLQGPRVDDAVQPAAVGRAGGRQRQHRRHRVARAARHHRQPAGGQAEHGPAGHGRFDLDGVGSGVRRRQPTTAGSARSTRKTGKELWVVKLNASVSATPSTYLGKDGRQYVVVVATGGALGGAPLTSDEIVAFRIKKP